MILKVVIYSSELYGDENCRLIWMRPDGQNIRDSWLMTWGLTSPHREFALPTWARF